MIALTHGNPSNIRSGFGIEEVAISGSTAAFDTDDINKHALTYLQASKLHTERYKKHQTQPVAHPAQI